MTQPKLGVVIVTYNAADLIEACLASLLPCPADRMQIVVVDNGSTDDTVDIVARRAEVDAQVRLVCSSVNGGFAAGVNLGAAEVMQDSSVTHLWILNPDCEVTPGSVSQLLYFLATGRGAGLTGGRVAYYAESDRIQSDGGRIDMRTGVTHSLNQGLSAERAPAPDVDQIDFVSGACLVASRAYWREVGPMDEGYFLFYEEVDWALRRGRFPIAYCPDLAVRHHAGASIGSAGPGNGGSPFAAYFLHRSRMRFLQIYSQPGRVRAYLFTIGKAVQQALRGHPVVAAAILRGGFGLPPSRSIARRLSQDSLELLSFERYKTSTSDSASIPARVPSQTTR